MFEPFVIVVHGTFDPAPIYMSVFDGGLFGWRGHLARLNIMAFDALDLMSLGHFSSGFAASCGGL